MSRFKLKYISSLSVFGLIITAVWGSTPALLPELTGIEMEYLALLLPPDSSQEDTSKSKMPYPIRDRKPWERSQSKHPFDLGEPSIITNKYTLDPETNEYNYSSKVGTQDYRLPATLNTKQQLAEENKLKNKEYFRQRAQANNYTSGTGIIPPLKIGPKVFERIFGTGVIDIRPRGTAELIFQGLFNTVRNPALPPQQQTTGQFDFRQKIQLNVQGSIGDRMKVNINYDTEATFDFENQIKLDYGGKEDDIIKKIELGNVSLPLNSSLIQGSQSLFGVKTEMQFGRLKVTSIFTQQRGQTTETEITGGAQTTKFNIQSDNYDVNRHFFLAHYFRDNYDNWLANLPIIGSPVVLGRVEVWITNRTGVFEGSRDVAGFADLGEASRRDNKNWALSLNPRDTFPDNGSSQLYFYLTGRTPINGDTASLRSSLNLQNQLLRDQPQTQLQPISQYQILSYARLLNPNEFTVNRQLGYISLNQTLNNDDILMVAFEYTLNGRTYRVGEFSTDIPQNPQTPNVIFAKMLKGPSLRPDLPLWDLMMKNVYSLGAFGIQQKDFRFNIVYADDPSGADLNYLPVQNEPLLTGQPLIQVLNLDNMNTQQERAPDGLFDFIEGVTVNTQQGRIIFPTIEPFGENLRKKFINNPTLARYYSFYELYDSTRFAAIQLPQYNKFFIRGSYQGQSGSEVSLNATNIPRGSVRVTANGAPLTENVDYTVDYNLGRVKILNSGLLNSGAVIKVSSESNSLFSIQQKTLLGSRFDYKVHRDFLLGGTVLYLNERPLTPKVNLGEEPISNMVIGVDGSYKRESRFLTKLVDKLPFLQTKEISTIALSGEYARLFPGVQSALAQNGTAYLDDFEAAETQFEIQGAVNWYLASTPQGQPDLFPEGNLANDLRYGFKRANLAWYNIANTFHITNTLTPEHIQNDPTMLSDHRMRLVKVEEVFPNRQIQRGMPDNLQTLDLAFYPRERGMYNYNPDLNADGTLDNPRSNWGGIMRRIENPDFEAANIDYIEIWMMDPTLSNPNPTNSGKLYINLGNISEDVLRDNRRTAENGLPRSTDPNQQFIDTTVWGRVPRAPVVNFAFDADPAVRLTQDVGLDGYDDLAERSAFDTAYLQRLAQVHPPGTPAYDQALQDPSNDNYHYFLGTDYDNQRLNILERYKKFNKQQGNSPTLDQSTEDYPTTATNMPDIEDINRDYTLNDIEEYYQYKIEIGKDRLIVGQNYVTDSSVSSVRLANGNTETVVWYQLKVPIREYERKVGQIFDFRSIRFIRMYMRDFENDQVLRFARIQLVRADWRKYLNSLEEGKENKPSDDADQTQFVVSTVNIEKNRARQPIPYKVPPGIQREIDFSAPQALQQNEQSLSLLVCNLVDGDARGVFKNTQVDLRQYGRLRMFLHAEGQNLNDGDVTAFIRLGTDLTNNYYEFEMPLKVSRSGGTDRDVWPEENELNLILEDFIDTKIARTNANHPFTARFSRLVGRGKMTVIGLPDLSNVRVMMLGVRNPKAIPGAVDDGAPKCAEVWFNELRMTEFSNRGGWAAVGMAQAKLADFGQMQIAGSMSTVSWGGIDKKIQQRQLDDRYQYDVQGSFELAKFLPKTSGFSIPMFVSYGNTLIRPFYNPLNMDTRLQKEIDETTNEERRTRISQAADDFTARRSINFTNIRKNRMGGGNTHIWDFENFSFTYSFNETYRRNQEIQYYLLQNYQTMINYSYTFKTKPWEPFKKIKSKQLTLLKDFNLFYLPQSWGARVQTDRRYGVTLNRSNDIGFSTVPALYDKMYTMSRYYEFAYNLSRGLTFNYTATALARIDEPLGRIDETTPQKRDTLWNNLFNGGRIMQFDQSTRFNYNIPINKIQQLNWVSQSSYTYQSTYQWKQAPPAADSLGNTISNARTIQWNFNFNMSMLYNKFNILREINNPGAKKQTTPKKKEDDKNAKAGKGKDGKETKEKKEEEENTKRNPVLVATMRLIMSLKNLNYSHTINEGTTLPGFRFKPEYVGNNFTNDAPGLDYILGVQDDEFRFKAGRNGWLARDPRITSMYMQDFREQITGRATFEPLPDFRIDLNISKQRSLQQSVIFRYSDSIGDFADINQALETGTFSMTYNAWRTSFNSEDAFRQMQENRILIAQKLAQNPEKPGLGIDSVGFPIGYGRAAQDVLIPSFLAAYSGTDVNKVGLTAFPSLPDANWKITYNGLSKLEWVKEYANNVQINNQYTSNYTVSGFQNILQDTSSVNGFTGDYVPKYQIRQISIVERWGPFLGIDITFVNNITTKLEYKRDRAINFGLSNGQISEQAGNEFVFGAGYRTSKLVLPFKMPGGRRIVLDSDINFRFDFSIQERVTTIRYLDRETTDPVQGQTIYQLRPNIDYMISQQLMLRIFYDYRRTDPATSNVFPTVIQSGGFSLRYTIQ